MKMARLKILLLLGISYAIILEKSLAALVPSPEPSIELFFPPHLQSANQSAVLTTVAPTISERIQASINTVLRIPLPLPLWGTVVSPPSQAPQNNLPLSQSQAAQLAAENLIAEQPKVVQQNNPSRQPQLIGAFKNPSETQPTSFLPDVNQAITSTIAQLSTLSHWPFGYVTTSKPQPHHRVQSVAAPPTTPATQPTTTTRKATTIPPRTTASSATTITASTRANPTTISSSAVAAPTPPFPPSRPTQAMTQVPVLPSFILPSASGGFAYPLPPAIISTNGLQAHQSLPDRIHNRIQSTLSYIRIPTLSQIGQRPRPMLTEPPWVTEILGPTLEPPTTRAPTFGERIQNSIQNVLFFVPATLLNFWYDNWGKQNVDRIINRIQIPTPKPGVPVQPVYATVSQNGSKPFFNFTTGALGGAGANGTSTLPPIAAFVNTNGTLMPTIVHPVVNTSANTIEYQLIKDNQTTILWTGSLSNDIFFGNKTITEEEALDIEDDEEEQNLINLAINIKKE